MWGGGGIQVCLHSTLLWVSIIHVTQLQIGCTLNSCKTLIGVQMHAWSYAPQLTILMALIPFHH